MVQGYTISWYIYSIFELNCSSLSLASRCIFTVTQVWSTYAVYSCKINYSFVPSYIISWFSMIVQSFYKSQPLLDLPIYCHVSSVGVYSNCCHLPKKTLSPLAKKQSPNLKVVVQYVLMILSALDYYLNHRWFHSKYQLHRQNIMSVHLWIYYDIPRE